VSAEFWEIGASGRRYSRAYVLKTLAQRAAARTEDSWETRDFHCRELAPGVFLLTYTLRQGQRVTRRATLWQRRARHWRILFHQGTVVEEPKESRNGWSEPSRSVSRHRQPGGDRHDPRRARRP
jgi:hypothetical protein